MSTISHILSSILRTNFFSFVQLNIVKNPVSRDSKEKAEGPFLSRGDRRENGEKAERGGVRAI